MKKVILLVALAMVFATTTMAQENKQEVKKMTPKEFAAKKINYLAKKAELNETDKEVLEKAHTEYVAAMKLVRAEFHNWNKAKKAEAKEQNKDYKKALDDTFNAKEKMLKIEKDYVYELAEKLSPEKAYKIMRAEVAFHRHMVKGINNRYKIKKGHHKKSMEKAK